MDYSEYVILEMDIAHYHQEKQGKIADILHDIQLQLPKKLQAEFAEKEKEIIRSPHLTENKIAITYTVHVPDASDQLNDALEKIYTDIICLKD